MKTQVSPIVVVLVIIAVVAVAVVLGYGTVRKAGGGDSAVGVSKDGRPMTSVQNRLSGNTDSVGRGPQGLIRVRLTLPITTPYRRRDDPSPLGRVRLRRTQISPFPNLLNHQS